MQYISALEIEFRNSSNVQIASEQKAYLRNQFEFYGIKAPVRQEILKPFFIKAYLPPKEELFNIVKILWEKPQREFQYAAQELTYKYVRNLNEDDIQLFEYMVIHKSWWDTVDFIAVKLVGAYFKKYPHLINVYVQKWLASGNIWLQRSALLFQLNYKTGLDTDLLEHTIRPLLGSREFFINKAIGWVLRHYSRTNPAWVIDFVNKTGLNSLSKKEALRLIK